MKSLIYINRYFITQTGTPHDEIIGNSNQPMIVVIYDVEDNTRNHYYIMVEQELLQDTHHFNETVFLLLAVHYVFDLQYNAAVFDTLLFIQEFVCQLKDRKNKHSAFYTSISTRLYRASQK